MARLRLLHGIHGESANCVGHTPMDRFGGLPFVRRHCGGFDRWSHGLARRSVTSHRFGRRRLVLQKTGLGLSTPAPQVNEMGWFAGAIHMSLANTPDGLSAVKVIPP